MNCYLSRNYKNLSSAGNKAKTDIEQIMSRNGFKNVGLKQTTYTHPFLAFLFTLTSVLKVPFCLQAGDCLVLQYPLKKYFTLVCRMAHLKKAKVIVVIHDLGSFRRKKLTISGEIQRLSNADYIIAHNVHMKNWLTDNGCIIPIGELGIFDFLSPSPIPIHKLANPPYKVVYAGGLSYRKNTFLYEVGAHIHSYSFLLYGNGFERDKATGREHFHYKGFVPSDELIATVQGDFGLVWDGFSIEACTGDFGEYLRYNNPHKTSLYLRCGLPVIIWKQAALASFIEENQIGFCIETLSEIDSILTSLTEKEYARMKKKAIHTGKLLEKGHFITQALAKACHEMNNTQQPKRI